MVIRTFRNAGLAVALGAVTLTGCTSYIKRDEFDSTISELRATDPWVTISPDGTAYFMTLSIGDPDVDPTSVMYVNRSTNGGLTWGPPIELIRDESSFLFNDKNSMTADPNDSSFVYAVWDRLAVIGPDFKGPTLFTRTTNGGRSWEKARVIFNPGAFAQTLGNQIAVRPQGELFNIFTLIE